MKRFLSILLTLILITSVFVQSVYAISDPLGVPNNKIGIHILFPSELSDAAKLVNSSGGDWGYVTIPIQDIDMDLQKWQTFMDQCKQLHLIPLVRLATEGDYFHTSDWRAPNYDNIIDFANFLNSLDWPTQNRYIIVYNEVNRGDEWSGKVDPIAYAQLLDYAVKEFHHVSPNFFVISAGLDNAAPNQGTTYMNEYDFYRAMAAAVPNIFSEIDGMSSHAYPNPGFVGSPTDTTDDSIDSFKYEQNLLQALGGKKLPVFITETGWTDDLLSDNTITGYYQQALHTVWDDPSIVAITPFLLDANQGSFVPFSLIKPDGSTSQQYAFLQNFPKIKGQPLLPLSTQQILAASVSDNSIPHVIKSFPSIMPLNTKYSTVATSVKTVFNWIFKL